MAEEKSGERIYTIPLRKEWLKVPRTKRTNKSVRTVRDFLIRHMKSDQVMISEKLNQKIWFRGIHSPPGKIKIKAVIDQEGIVRAMLPEEKSEKEGVKDKKEKKESKEETSSEKTPAEEKEMPKEVKEEPRVKEKTEKPQSK